MAVDFRKMDDLLTELEDYYKRGKGEEALEVVDDLTALINDLEDEITYLMEG